MCSEGPTLCFVEVRSRSSSRYGTAAETIGPTKQARIARTAEHFLAYAWRGGPCPCRFDVVTIDEDAQPPLTLIRDAFRIGGR